MLYIIDSDIMVTCCSTVRGNFQLNCFMLPQRLIPVLYVASTIIHNNSLVDSRSIHLCLCTCP